MDAHDWHRQATRPPTPWPDPVTFEQYEAMTQQARDEYLVALSTAFHQATLPSREADLACAHLDRIVQTNLLRPPGAMQMVALTAPFSAGKSTLVKQQWGYRVYRDMIGDRIQEDRPTWSPQPGVTADWLPVVYVTLMASSSIKEVNAQLLLYCGYPPEGLARTTTTRVLQALRMHGVKVVILDDAHMLRSTSAQGRAVLDYIKFLNTELGERHGTVILVGANLDKTALLDDPQIRARLTRLSIAPFSIDNVIQRSEWQGFLKDAEACELPYLPDAQIGVFSRVHAQHVWRRTQGFVGEATKLVGGAILRAFQDRTSVITRDDLDVVTLSERSIDGQIDQLALEQKPPRRGQ